MIYLSDRARGALRTNEVLVFDWVPIALCGGPAGEHSLRLTTYETVNPAIYLPLPADGHPPGRVVAHRLGYPQLVELDIHLDCRRWLGLRRFHSDLPPDTGLRAALGRTPPAPDAPTNPRRLYAAVLGGVQ